MDCYVRFYAYDYYMLVLDYDDFILDHISTGSHLHDERCFDRSVLPCYLIIWNLDQQINWMVGEKKRSK